jgi:hypothetical protein
MTSRRERGEALPQLRGERRFVAQRTVPLDRGVDRVE